MQRVMRDTAMRLMQGGQVPSVSEVAEAAEVSRATAYRYFPSQASIIQAAVNEVAGPASPLRPSVILKPVLDAYAAILEDAAAIDIQRLLEPVLQEFAVITASLDSNLERSEGAFARLQGALP